MVSLENLCSDIILGNDFIKQHKNLTFPFGGEKEDLIVTRKNNLCTATGEDKNRFLVYKYFRRNTVNSYQIKKI